MNKSVILLMLISFNCWSMETDQYLSWKRDLKDSSKIINGFINKKINNVIKKINKNNADEYSCVQVAKKIYRSFRLVFVHRIEFWLIDHEEIDQAPKNYTLLEYYNESIFGKKGQKVWPIWMPLAPTIRVGDVYFGTDKLGHYMSLGQQYYTRYLEYRDEGLNDEEAQLKVMEFGWWNETSYMGNWSTGIISLADLEANIQGMHLGLFLCGKDPYLIFDKEKNIWRTKIENGYDLREYVNPLWDESYFPSVFSKTRWKYALPVIKKYCELADSDRIKKRFEAYEKMDNQGKIKDFARKMIKSEEIEDNYSYSYKNVCM